MASLRLIACALALAGCYDIPRPQCGFQCGPADECPDGYSCVGNRCRLDDDRPFSCPAIIDPPITDVTRPGLQARSPMPNEADVPLDAPVLVTFDEEVMGVNAATFGVSTDTGFVMGFVFELSPNRAWRFLPEDGFARNKTYEVVLGSAITDLAGNPLPETRWGFSTIEDRTPPQIIALNFPTDGASLTDDLIVVFDEPIVGVTPLSVHLEQAGTTVPTTLGALPDQFRLEHDPLLSETTYSIVMTSAVTDIYGNAIAPTTLSFTTLDATPPTITNREPAPDATNVALDAIVAVRFSEDVDVDTDSVQLSSTTGLVDVAWNYDLTFQLTLTPTAPLDPATTYTVSFQTIRDLANNPATFPSYTFITAP